MSPLLMCNLFIIYYFLGLVYSAYYHAVRLIDSEMLLEMNERNDKEEMFTVYSMLLFVVPTFWPLFILYNLTMYGEI